MKKVLSIRADESTQKDLKILAAMKEIPIGDLLDFLVKEEMVRIRRNTDLLASVDRERKKDRR
jgi:hypothetical protein